ncbi:helix-turn-helix transcriptional regulator [Dyadobacter sediminis]|uniref:Helix-turn-helix transcriptional regulator n=1 Tax=Dyadobacter sediminis TaxID=1493691 RepID=A0A5R9K9Z1_9BACT|nr:helix-turn-helix transcriptional regulator [Dyadobacter sediminis]TLU91616.1 helix-turn-helix transcriptional regulator [Dyadobacter sediminis]GGC01862.1 hypothetical protein GCM10011325_31260 [Dyadobacter sediminis]
MKETDILSIIRKGEITSELDLERAVLAERSLRMLSEEQPELKPMRKELRALIIQYESAHWSDESLVTEAQVAESDAAEIQAATEFKFFRRRRALILEKLKSLGLKQNDLGILLAHSKSYTSELLNGIRAFSANDLLLIHKLLDIDMEDLFFTEIPAATLNRIQGSLQKMAERNIKLDKNGLKLVPPAKKRLSESTL